MKRIGGLRRKTRHKLKKSYREKGKFSLKKYFQTFNNGDIVQLIIEPSVHEGMFHPRFYGKHGKIIGKRGRAYIVEINDQGKIKELIVKPIHLKLVKPAQ